MEGNKDEALRCLAIAQRHRDSGNVASARKFCQKSINLFSTPEALKLLASINSVPPSAAEPGSSTSTETHPSASGAKRRNGSTNGVGTAGGIGGEKREYTPEQIEVVKRVRACKVTEYYEILAVTKDCEDADIKRAYRKLALALHPDKNGAPGADEAFKLVSKAFQVLSDPQKRAAHDQYGSDPDSRFGGMPSRSAASPFSAGATFDGEMSPEDLFNMFFNGGGTSFGGPFGGPVFTATFGPGGFRTTRPLRPRRRERPEADQAPQARSVLLQLLPLILLFALSFLSSLPSLFGTTPIPDPHFSFSPTPRYNMERHTGGLGIRYHVNMQEFSAHPQIAADLAATNAGVVRGKRGPALSRFEGTVERLYTEELYSQCQRGLERRMRKKEAEVGLFGIGTDWEKVRQIDREVVESCEELKRLGVLR